MAPALHRLSPVLKSRLGPLLLLASLAGCTPSIGDKCVLSTDCSTRGDRLCDTSQPGGYCTQFNCSSNSCPDEAACVLFNAALQGCTYDDRAGGYGSRVARSFCVASCSTNADCRGGYICADPRTPPWNAFIQDTDQSKRTCLVPPEGYDADGGVDASFPPVTGAPVCSAVGPPVGPIDASAPRVDDGGGPPVVTDAGVDAADAGADAADASDGG